MAAQVQQAPVVQPAAPAAPAAAPTLSSWETGVNTYMVEFISNNLIDINSYFGMKAGETMMNVVKAVALVFASLLLLPLSAIGWTVSKLKACCTSTTPAQPQAPPAPAQQQQAAAPAQEQAAPAQQQAPAAPQQEVQAPAAQQQAPAAQQQAPAAPQQAPAAQQQAPDAE
ncbi:MAG: hypothetical protein K1X28_00525 [Parachlamydiales bacterium]|nr:hypothetical protein [Parachlamydiales bacterium]